MTKQEIVHAVASRGGRCDCCRLPYRDPNSAVLAHSRNGSENPLVCRPCKTVLDSMSRLNSYEAMQNVFSFLNRTIAR
jgi:hypothetical protein